MIQKEINDELEKNLELIKNMIAELKYGNVVIVVQDGKIVQIDKTEKYGVKNWLDIQRLLKVYQEYFWLLIIGEKIVSIVNGMVTKYRRSILMIGEYWSNYVKSVFKNRAASW